MVRNPRFGHSPAGAVAARNITPDYLYEKLKDAGTNPAELDQLVSDIQEYKGSIVKAYAADRNGGTIDLDLGQECSIFGFGLSSLMHLSEAAIASYFQLEGNFVASLVVAVGIPCYSLINSKLSLLQVEPYFYSNMTSFILVLLNFEGGLEVILLTSIQLVDVLRQLYAAIYYRFIGVIPTCCLNAGVTYEYKAHYLNKVQSLAETMSGAITAGDKVDDPCLILFLALFNIPEGFVYGLVELLEFLNRGWQEVLSVYYFFCKPEDSFGGPYRVFDRQVAILVKEYNVTLVINLLFLVVILYTEISLELENSLNATS